MSPRETGDPDPLRSALRDLGYLENPLTRFFAGGPGSRRPALATHLRVGVAVGLALGLLASLLSALVLLASPVPQSAALLGALVLFMFLAAAALGLIAALAMFILYRATRRIVDRAMLVAQCAQLAAFLLVFLYLAVFWRNYGPAPWGTVGPPTLAMHLAAALAITLVAWGTGKVFKVATFAVLARLPGFRFAGRRRGARRALLVGVLLLWVALAAALFSNAPAKHADFAEKGARIERVAPPFPQVVLLAIDGFDLDNAKDAMARGWMPHLAELASRGRTQPLATGVAAIPPAFWTTVATGLSVTRHRIDAYYRDRVVGLSQAVNDALEDSGRQGLLETVSLLARIAGFAEEVPITGSMSRFKRVADVAAEAGLATASINYWATYPADAFLGRTVSERAYIVLREAQRRGTAVDERIAHDADPDLARFLHPESDLAAALPAIAEQGLTGNHATALPALYDLFVQDAALAALDREKLQYLQVGATGLDILRKSYLSAETLDSDARLVARARVLQGYFSFLDGFIGRLRERMDPGGLLVVAGYPGISARGGAVGFLAFSGAGVAQGAADEAFAPEDLAPTLLYALGLPKSREQDGHVRTGWIVPDLLEKIADPTQEVSAFGLKKVSDDTDLSSAMQLRFLQENGYLFKG